MKRALPAVLALVILLLGLAIWFNARDLGADAPEATRAAGARPNAPIHDLVTDAAGASLATVEAQSPRTQGAGGPGNDQQAAAPGRIQVRTVDRNGEPLGGALVHLQDADFHYPDAKAVSDPVTGLCTLELTQDVLDGTSPARSHVITFGSPLDPNPRVPVDPFAPPLEPIELRLPSATGHVIIDFLDEQGAPYASAGSLMLHRMDRLDPATGFALSEHKITLPLEAQQSLEWKHFELGAATNSTGAPGRSTTMSHSTSMAPNARARWCAWSRSWTCEGHWWRAVPWTRAGSPGAQVPTTCSRSNSRRSRAATEPVPRVPRPRHVAGRARRGDGPASLRIAGSRLRLAAARRARVTKSPGLREVAGGGR